MPSTTHIIRRRRARQRRQRLQQARRSGTLGLIAALALLLLVLPTGAAVGATVAFYWSTVRELPTPEQSAARSPIIGPTELYDRTGTLLLLAVRSPLAGGSGWAALNTLPRHLIDATLTAEDPAFFSRPPSDLTASALKLWRNLLMGPLPPDASITGRLVRAVAAPLPELVTRADIAREIALVAEVERRYTREQILEWHLNTAYYGSDAYGIEAAADVYFGKRAADLTLDEAALLAPIALAPQYNPFDNEQAARGRQLDLLRALRTADLIDGSAFELAAATRTAVQAGADPTLMIAPEFTAYARRQASAILDTLGRDGARLVASGGLKIITTLDLDLYYQSECALRTHLARIAGRASSPDTLAGTPCQSAAFLPPPGTPAAAPPDSGALALLDATTGEIKSWVGAAGQPLYPPGLTLQPFIYFEGFRNGFYTPAAMVLDIPSTFPGAAEGLVYAPANPDGRFYGPVNLRDAMSAGLAAPAAQVARQQGLENVLRVAHRIGLNTLGEDGRYDLSLLERGGAVSALDMTYAYSVFATLGQMRGLPVEPIARGFRQRSPAAVSRIEDAAGNVLWAYTPEQAALNQVGVFPAGIGYLVNDVLADAEARQRLLGEGTAVRIGRPAAVVNGLAGDRTASWTVGYTPYLTAGLVLSRADGGALTLDTWNMTGSAPVWQAVMTYAHARDALPPDNWPRPDEIVTLPVCDRSGLLANAVCPAYDELFLAEFTPTQTDGFWQTFEINSQTLQLATASTPPGLRSQRVYFIPPPDAADWWRANGLPLPPEQYDVVSIPTETFSAVQIVQPAPFDYVSGRVDIIGTLGPTAFQFFQLAYGQGPNPTEWTQIGERQTSAPLGRSLGVWDTTGLSGLYNIQLTVVLPDSARQSRSVQVTVDNRPPTISLSAGGPDKVYRWPSDQAVTLEADVSDDYAIVRVEFYQSNQFLGADTSWPYRFDWPITRTGIELFAAVAYDAAGNQARAETTVEIIRAVP